MKKIAILQSNYIPWKGYFDMINMVDEFVLYDDVQYTKNDWRNRNKIKTPTGSRWITIPVRRKSLSQKIIDTQVADLGWRRKHWMTIKCNYSKAKYFKVYEDVFRKLYLDSEETYLSQINYDFIMIICDILKIKTKIRWSNEFNLKKGKSEKLLSICKELGAHKYLSGPAAKNYLDESLFRESGIGIEWMDYSDYPEYMQHGDTFEHEVSILDLLFHEGPNATKFMKSFK